MATTITIDPAVRDRLKGYGIHGMTYDEILSRMMDELERRAFIAEMRRMLETTRDADWVDLGEIETEPKGTAGSRGGKRAASRASRSKARSS